MRQRISLRQIFVTAACLSVLAAFAAVPAQAQTLSWGAGLGQLAIDFGSPGNVIAVSSSTSNTVVVTINGSPAAINNEPTTGILAADVTRINVDGTAGNDTLDLTAMSLDVFSNPELQDGVNFGGLRNGSSSNGLFDGDDVLLLGAIYGSNFKMGAGNDAVVLENANAANASGTYRGQGGSDFFSIDVPTSRTVIFQGDLDDDVYGFAAFPAAGSIAEVYEFVGGGGNDKVYWYADGTDAAEVTTNTVQGTGTGILRIGDEVTPDYDKVETLEEVFHFASWIPQFGNLKVFVHDDEYLKVEVGGGEVSVRNPIAGEPGVVFNSPAPTADVRRMRVVGTSGNNTLDLSQVRPNEFSDPRFQDGGGSGGISNADGPDLGGGDDVLIVGGGYYRDFNMGTGNDLIHVASQRGGFAKGAIYGGAGNDEILVDVQATTGPLVLVGGGDDDTITLQRLPAAGSVYDIDGGDGNDLLRWFPDFTDVADTGSQLVGTGLGDIGYQRIETTYTLGAIAEWNVSQLGLLQLYVEDGGTVRVGAEDSSETLVMDPARLDDPKVPIISSIFGRPFVRVPGDLQRIEVNVRDDTAASKTLDFSGMSAALFSDADFQTGANLGGIFLNAGDANIGPGPDTLLMGTGNYRDLQMGPGDDLIAMKANAAVSTGTVRGNADNDLIIVEPALSNANMAIITGGGVDEVRVERFPLINTQLRLFTNAGEPATLIWQPDGTDATDNANGLIRGTGTGEIIYSDPADWFRQIPEPNSARHWTLF